MTSAPHAAFAARLHRTLDTAGFAPGRRRTSALAGHHGVSRETARKWLMGMALPELERMIEIATEHGVSFEWLATGRGAKDGKLSVRDTVSDYRDPDEAKLLILVRALPRKKRRALIDLLDPA